MVSAFHGQGRQERWLRSLHDPLSQINFVRKRMAACTTRNPEGSNSAYNKYPMLAPRIWHGMKLGGWARLISQNNYDIHRWPMASMISMCAAGNSILGWLHDRMLGQQIADKDLAGAPTFILGHWRTGTTLLHELLSLDDRYATPTNYECFAPHHHLLTSGVIPWVLKMPSRRPMDNIEMGWHAPQEDEFALCTLGLPSPYRRIAFPNRPARHFDYLNMDGVPPRELSTWKIGLMKFVKSLNYRADRPLILKSPPHTGRVKTLLELFPNARFVHLSRNPYDFIPSTVHLWRALDDSNGLQRPNNEASLQDYVFECFRRMYGGYDRDRSLIPEGNLIEIRYEDLTANPIETLKTVYQRLSLGEFDPVAEKVIAFLSRKNNYKRNQHTITAELRDLISTHCAAYMQRYGQDAAPSAEVAAA